MERYEDDMIGFIEEVYEIEDVPYEEPDMTCDKAVFMDGYLIGYRDGIEIVKAGPYENLASVALKLFDADGNEIPVTYAEGMTPKDLKIAELGAACEAAIFTGVTVETTQGTEHFSLTLNDQTNLGNLMLQAQSAHLSYITRTASSAGGSPRRKYRP